MTTTERELNLDRIVEILVNQHRLDQAYVEQTGGGVATIYAGPTRPDPEDPSARRFAAVAGPGSYGWGHRASVASLDEFYVGPDDQGEADAIDVATVGAVTEEQVAALIAAQARRADPTQPVDADELTALGLDPSGRSLPADMSRDREELSAWVAAANESNRRLIAEGVEDRTAANEAAGDAAVAQLRAARAESDQS